MKIGTKEEKEKVGEIVQKMINFQVLRLSDEEIKEQDEWLEMMQDMFGYEAVCQFRKLFVMAVERELMIRWSLK
jgi:hypothetical protein